MDQFQLVKFESLSSGSEADLRTAKGRHCHEFSKYFENLTVMDDKNFVIWANYAQVLDAQNPKKDSVDKTTWLQAFQKSVSKSIGKIFTGEISETDYDMVLLGERLASPISFSDKDRTFLENERLKSQLMAQRRDLLASQKKQDDLIAQNDKLVNAICDLAKINKTLHEVVLARQQARVCLHETHQGVVSDVAGTQLEVTYETSEGVLKQIYDESQFMQGRLPEEGDAIEAHVIVIFANKDEGKNKEADFVSKLPNFRDKAVSGPITL